MNLCNSSHLERDGKEQQEVPMSANWYTTSNIKVTRFKKVEIEDEYLRLSSELCKCTEAHVYSNSHITHDKYTQEIFKGFDKIFVNEQRKTLPKSI